MSQSHDPEQQRADALARRFMRGDLSRRDFLRRAGGFSAAVLATTSLGTIVAACGGSPATASPSSGASQGPSAAPASPSAAATAAAKSGGNLQAALTGEPDSLDPASSSIYTGAQVYDNIFSKLVDLDENNQIVGVLATKWNQPDPKTWVFDLVDNATFHNGEKFSADDVKYTFERVLDPKTASGYTPLYDAIASMEATSPTRITFKLKTPFGPFLNNLANNGEIVNKKAIEAKDPARNPVGTGPFQFVEWVQGDHITLKKFSGYFRQGKPYLDGVQPMRRRTSRAWVERSAPATVAVPAVGLSKVVSMRRVVVLPAPLGPSRPTNLAGGNVEVDPSNGVDRAGLGAKASGEAAGADHRGSVGRGHARHSSQA